MFQRGRYKTYTKTNMSNGSYVPYEHNSIHHFNTDTSLYT